MCVSESARLRRSSRNGRALCVGPHGNGRCCPALLEAGSPKACDGRDALSAKRTHCREVRALHAAERIDRHTRTADKFAEALPSERRGAWMARGRQHGRKRDEIHAEPFSLRQLLLCMAGCRKQLL